MSSWKRWVVVASLGSIAACGQSTTGGDSGEGHDASRTETGPADTGAMDAHAGDTSAGDASKGDAFVGDATKGDTGADDASTTDVLDATAGDTGGDAAGEASVDAGADVPLVDGGACGAVVDLNAAGTLTGATTRYVGTTSGSPMAGALTASCGSADHEVVLAYTARAAATLTVSVANAGTPIMFDTVVFALASCDGSAGAELGCNDDRLPDRRSFLTTSQVAAGQTVYLVVAGSTTSGSYADNGPFELTVRENAIGGPCDTTATPSSCGTGFECVGTGTTGACRGYAQSSLATPTWIDACATGTHETLSGRDDGHTSTLTLPFTFTYFGRDYTSASADTNGYLVLGDATPSDNYDAPLPLSDGPVIAPFHDDLVIAAAPAGDLCTLTVGTGASQQFVVEWTGASRYNHGSVNLTFEAVLSQATNTVDFIYQTLDASASDAPYADGTNASIGLEGDDGNTVVLHTGTVTTSTGLRYTPVAP